MTASVGRRIISKYNHAHTLSLFLSQKLLFYCLAVVPHLVRSTAAALVLDKVDAAAFLLTLQRLVLVCTSGLCLGPAGQSSIYMAHRPTQHHTSHFPST